MIALELGSVANIHKCDRPGAIHTNIDEYLMRRTRSASVAEMPATCLNEGQ